MIIAKHDQLHFTIVSKTTLKNYMVNPKNGNRRGRRGRGGTIEMADCLLFLIIEGFLGMTITLTETMCMVSRREECDCSHVDSAYVVKKM